MFDIFVVISKVQQALALAQLLKPILGDHADMIDDVTDLAGKALVGVKFGVTSYETLCDELDGVIAEMNAIRAKGGVEGGDIRNEVTAIRSRGNSVDAIMKRLKG